MGIKIDTLLENNIISNNILSIIPNKCRCGSDIEFSDSIKEIRCTNKNCKFKTLSRIQSFNDKLNIRLSEQTILSLIDALNLVTPYQILMLDILLETNNDRIKNIDIPDKEELIQNIKNIKQSEYLLYEVVELCGIENIVNVAYKVFNGFDNIDEAFNEIELGQVSFLNERLGIKNQDSTVFSLEIFNSLMNIKEELIFAESLFNLKKSDKEKINIAFNDSILPFINVGELIEWLNYKYNYQFNHVTTISTSTDILVRGADTISSKYRIARLINDKNIADLMNNSDLKLKDIGKDNPNELKPNGHIIYIDNLDNIISKLDKLSG